MHLPVTLCTDTQICSDLGVARSPLPFFSLPLLPSPMNMYWDATVVSSVNLYGLCAWAAWSASPERLETLQRLPPDILFHEADGFSQREGNYVEEEPWPYPFDEIAPEQLLVRLCRDPNCLRCICRLGGYDFLWRGPWTPHFGSVPPAWDIFDAYEKCRSLDWPWGLYDILPTYVQDEPAAVEAAEQELAWQPPSTRELDFRFLLR